MTGALRDPDDHRPVTEEQAAQWWDDESGRRAEDVARRYVDWEQEERARRQMAAEELPKLRERVVALVTAKLMHLPEDPHIDALQKHFDEIGQIDELIIRQMLFDVLLAGTFRAEDAARNRLARLAYVKDVGDLLGGAR